MKSKKSSYQTAMNVMKKYMKWSFIQDLLANPAKLPIIAVFILIAEVVINVFVVERVPYTEIDWKAYMQECEGFLNGTWDYSKLRGDTGPLVYPAGFVYIYSLFYFITNRGTNIKLAQYIFIVIYILQLLFMFRIYIKSRKVPPYVLLLTILTSYRIHSIYVLRLFNDPIAVLLFYVALNLFIDSRWKLGSVIFSLAVSVKMNILLYAPALLLYYVFNLGLVGTIMALLCCAFVQLVLAIPFLLSNPYSYLKQSFDVGRVFDHTWTVNYRFLDVETFESKYFHVTLLVIHLALLGVFFPMFKKYFTSFGRLRYVQEYMQPQIDAKNRENKRIKKEGKDSKGKASSKQAKEDEEPMTEDQEKFLKSFEDVLQKANEGKRKETKKPKPEPFYSVNFNSISQLCILPMFLCNFIGVVCARSLHYQFYSWYFHSLPYLLWSTGYSVGLRFLLLALIEFSWNTYPSTVYSSAVLHACHVAILWNILRKYRAESNKISSL